MTTQARDKMFFYERIAARFDRVMNGYEMRKRLRILFDDLLAGDLLRDKELLDAGCGTGWFSEAACRRGARVTSLDLGEGLLAEVAKKCDSRRVVGSVLELPFPDASFDVVMSTEVIEHTPDPKRAVSELCRVLRPGGTLVVTVPCRTWKWSVVLANRLGLRPYDGHENWVGYFELRRWAEAHGIRTERHFGFNLIPFQLSFTHPFIDFMDRFGAWLGPLMINIALKGTKRE